PSAADVAREVGARADADVVLMAAAVSDYRPEEAYLGKRAKDGEPWLVRLEPTEDVLRTIGARRVPDGTGVLVGFAADEGGRGLERAREKLVAKGADLIVFNDVSREDVGFESPDNEVVLITRSAERRIDKAPKREIAAEVLDEVARLLKDGHGRAGRG
ncbi:MAG: bifunctional 4'-phosphopantothenoylcysteine decarboxylase/phosphopantothenoylcysteine synthetase, partial [Actinomycetota bacterium]|nr:bifunctional 4'-phosphopantothenoylcysteine decarboxylase/phosphopantothenoylcysteine synthetase [Actinomycetota bacterium]